jgi:hypothetical protein
LCCVFVAKIFFKIIAKHPLILSNRIDFCCENINTASYLIKKSVLILVIVILFSCKKENNAIPEQKVYFEYLPDDGGGLGSYI